MVRRLHAGMFACSLSLPAMRILASAENASAQITMHNLETTPGGIIICKLSLQRAHETPAARCLILTAFF